MPRAPSAPPTDARVWPLDGPRAILLDAIVSGLVMLRSAVPRSAALPADLDLAAGMTDQGAMIGDTIRLLAAALGTSITRRLISSRAISWSAG